MTDKEFFAYSPSEAVKPEFTEAYFIFKSLYPDLLPSLKLILHCDIPDIDQQVFIRVKNAAYREYAEIMKEKQIAAHGFNICGTWDMKGGEDNEEPVY